MELGLLALFAVLQPIGIILNFVLTSAVWTIALIGLLSSMSVVWLSRQERREQLSFAAGLAALLLLPHPFPGLLEDLAFALGPHMADWLFVKAIVSLGCPEGIVILGITSGVVSFGFGVAAWTATTVVFRAVRGG